MGILILESDDNIGFVIKKNPTSGMIKRKIRSCEMSGFYKKGSSSIYMIYARDFDDCSFCFPDQSSYLNPKIYSSATSVIFMISEFFDSVLKKCEKNDEPKHHKITINSFPPNEKSAKLINRLNAYFNTKVTISNESDVKVTTFEINNGTLHYLLNIIVVIMTVVASINNENLEIKDSFADKIVQCVTRLDSPYYIRYFLASRVLSSHDFNRLKPALEKSQSHKIKMFFGDTACQRRNLIEKYLTFENSILDVGCGEGSYLFPFSKKLKDGKKYVGFDIEEDIIEKLQTKIKKEEFTNVVICNKLSDVINECNKSSEIFDVIITEVIEHMELSDVPTFLAEIINNINFNKIIITTPNHKFNSNYLMDTKFRHDDHKWEIGKNEFSEMINKLKINRIVTLEFIATMKFIDVGDVVDDEPCTLGVVITK